MSCAIAENKTEVEINWNDGHVSMFHSLWLRFNCQCSVCKGDAPGCYSIDLTKFPDKFFVLNITFNDNSKIFEIQFYEEPYHAHVTLLDMIYLRDRCYCELCLEDKIQARSIVAKSSKRLEHLPSVDFRDIYIDKDDFLFRWMKNFFDFGICRVINFPSDDQGFMSAAKMLGHLENTPLAFNKPYFSNIINDRDLTDSGHTSHSLPFHMDYCYTESTGQAILHNCIRFDDVITGGESIVMNLFVAADILRKESPEDFKTLSEIPIVYEKIDNKSYFQLEKPCISIDYHGQIVKVRYAADYTPVLQVKGSDVEKFYRAYKKFTEIINRKELQFRFKHIPGTVITYDNRRLGHTRTSFDSNGGVRHFRELCVTMESMKSNFMRLADKLGMIVEAPAIGNGSSF